jgi:hypothetical protein
VNSLPDWTAALGKAKMPRYLLNGNRVSEALQHLGVNSHFTFIAIALGWPP